jgi:hypothetical protein
MTVRYAGRQAPQAGVQGADAPMRIYEGTPRQDWEDVLRAVGAYADRERIKEILLLELEGGILLQGLAFSSGSWSDSAGTLAKRTIELTDDQLGTLLDEAIARRDTGVAPHPETGMPSFYEQALRVLGRWLDARRPRDIFFFEQGGSFVLRALEASPVGGISHQLAEFTHDEILVMIDASPQLRDHAPGAGG